MEKQKNKDLPPKTAGRIMNKRVPMVFKSQTIGDIQSFLFKKINQFATINYFYVVDENKKLIGVFSVKEIFRRLENVKVGELNIMEGKIIKARVHTDQERVAFLALKNNIKAVPVVDKDDKFLGVVTSDTILDVLHNEQVEDILLAGGLRKDSKPIKELLTAPVSVLVKSRLPWLLLGLLGGVAAARIIGFFETTLENNILLALFIPVIVYISDAVATQTETLIIRGIAIEPELDIKKYFFREIKIGGLLGLTLAFLLGIFSFIWWQSLSLGVILSLAMFFGIFLSVNIAVIIPLFLRKMKKDPALGSGPFATIITDLLSITIYFLIANLLFSILG